jgi:hypothetical protein
MRYYWCNIICIGRPHPRPCQQLPFRRFAIKKHLQAFVHKDRLSQKGRSGGLITYFPENDGTFKQLPHLQIRTKKAEVDYLATYRGMVFPVEVKSGKSGTLKSLRLFLKEHPDTPFGIRFSMNELSWYDRVLSIPLYMAEYWQRFTEMVIQGLK